MRISGTLDVLIGRRSGKGCVSVQYSQAFYFMKRVCHFMNRFIQIMYLVVNAVVNMSAECTIHSLSLRGFLVISWNQYSDTPISSTETLITWLTVAVLHILHQSS